MARDSQSANPLARVATAFCAFSERYIPDAFVFALIATVVVVLAALSTSAAPASAIVDAWGKGFWELATFTLQMALVIITGYVLASAPLIYKMIRALAALPRTPRQAVALVTFAALASAWVNWGFSLIFSAIFAKEVARRRADVDYRALAASSFLGLGSIWAQGLSGSAALQMATAQALPARIREVVAHGAVVSGGMIPLRHTIFLWQSLVAVAVEIVVVTAVMVLATPTGARARTASDLGIDLGTTLDSPPPTEKARVPGEWLEHSPLLTLLVSLLAAIYLVRFFRNASDALNAINLNTINLAFLFVGFALHGTPARMMRAVRDATPAVWGVLLQFPFYAGIAGVISYTHLNESIAQLFVRASSQQTFPAVIAIYSAVLGVFVPSGGSKWVIEAPYVMEAAHTLRVHLGWMVAVYDLGEALANLVQPFWMLPVLGLLKLRARDVMGYTFLVFLILLPLVLLLVTLLGRTLHYPM